MADRGRILFGMFATTVLAGCSFAPAYHPPAIAAPLAFKESGPWQVATPSAVPPGADWWKAFGDITLDGLEARLATSNPSLSAAVSDYDEARGYLAEARSDLFPHVGLETDVTDNRQSDHRPTRGAGQPDLYPADTFEGDASYELDLWGRVRNSVAAGKAEAQASADDLAAVELSLQGELATSYLTLRGYDRQMSLLSATVDAYAQANRVTKNRFQIGIATGIEVGQSGDLLAEAQAQLDDVRAARAQTEHAIASLVGTPASSFSLPPSQVEFAIPIVPPGVPSTLLQRRPDVAAAERRMYAANREIGVAKAAFFPSISLGGEGGFQNTGLPSMFTAPNIFWSIGPSAVLSLFDGGRRRGQVAVSRAAWTKATASYRDDVLKAFQDVEDDLAQIHHLGDEAGAEQRAEQSAAEAEKLSLNRYMTGAVDYLDVVTSQTTALRVRRTVIDVDTRRLQATVHLIQATGGGWFIPDPKTLAENAATKATG